MAPPIYFPQSGAAWESRRPEDVGLKQASLDDAVAYAIAHETSWGTDLATVVREQHADEGEFAGTIGPTTPRGGPNGLITRHGYVVAEWGDTERVDMTFSVSKSYIATTAGLALDRGLIRDLDEPVRESVDDGGFDSPHNQAITWRHLLNQTSEWEGTLWGKPDQIDRNRTVQGDTAAAPKGTLRPLQAPGTFWEYNDVRVNRLALALLRRWRRPLPDVLRESIMDPIGASSTWQWHGYHNSYVPIDGQQMQSVSGGGHWGGGVWINTRDHARFGYLHLRNGVWDGRRLLSERWLELALTPCAVKPVYGCLWWLNTGRAHVPSAPESSFFAVGAGQNAIWIDPEHDIVAVVRWIDSASFDGFVSRILAAI